MKLSELMRYQVITIAENNCTTMSAEESEAIADKLTQCERLEEETGFSLDDISAIFKGMKDNEYIRADQVEIIKQRVAREIIKIIEQISRGEEYREYRISWGSKGTLDLILSTIEEEYLGG